MSAGADSFAHMCRQLCPLAASLLGWRPGDFWAATPAELAMALTPPAAAPPRAGVDRMTLQRLMEQDHER